MIVVDTNVLAELIRPEPAETVLHWAAEQPQAALFTTTVTQAEILFGLQLLSGGKRRTALERAVNGMFDEDFAGRILSFDGAAARAYSVIAAERRKAGRPIAPFDAQIAAIARSHGAAVATRNVADFAGCAIEVIDPWRR